MKAPTAAKAIRHLQFLGTPLCCEGPSLKRRGSGGFGQKLTFELVERFLPAHRDDFNDALRNLAVVRTPFLCRPYPMDPMTRWPERRRAAAADRGAQHAAPLRGEEETATDAH
jgi:hypothetical protein